MKSPAERWQVLQHAYVYNFDTVVLAISDSQSVLIRSYVIDYSEALRQSYDKVLLDLKNITLYWAYPDELSSRNDVLKIPDEVAEAADDIPTINGFETLQGTANLWHTIRKLPKPFPSLRRVIPSICAYWNAVKGGSDTTTKLMDDCILQIPKPSMNMETVAVTRLIQLLMVFCHRLFQCTSNKKALSEYPSLLHWRHAASERTTFHRTLLSFAATFTQEIEKLSRKRNSPPSTPSRQEEAQVRRSNRRAPVDGIIPSVVEFAPRLPTKTPSKISALLTAGTAPTEYMEMAAHCVGIPLNVYPSKANNKCALCRSNTSWYCVGCKRWFCITKTKNKVSELYCHKVRGEEKHFVRSCFHQAHTHAWAQHFSKQDNDSLPGIISSTSSVSSASFD